MKVIAASLVVVALLALGVWWQFDFFVVQPIGAVPEGRTLMIRRLNRESVRFIDSADGICQRTMGSVNLLCRGLTLAKVLEHATIVLRLPYSSWLYGISTGGRTYSH